jgi:hypothetical protein
MRIAQSVGFEAIEINKLQCVSKTVSCVNRHCHKKNTLNAVSISIQAIDKKSITVEAVVSAAISVTCSTEIYSSL